MVVSGVQRAPFFELRDYGVSDPRMVEIWKRRGMWPVLDERGRFLIPFETLAARERAWREVGGDAEWIGLGKRVVLKELTLFRLS